jgi:hypothetical protein
MLQNIDTLLLSIFPFHFACYSAHGDSGRALVAYRALLAAIKANTKVIAALISRGSNFPVLFFAINVPSSSVFWYHKKFPRKQTGGRFCDLTG